METLPNLPRYSAVPLVQPDEVRDPTTWRTGRAHVPLIFSQSGNALPAPVVETRTTSSLGRLKTVSNAMRPSTQDAPHSARTRFWGEVSRRFLGSQRGLGSSGSFDCPICCDTVEATNTALLSACGDPDHTCCRPCMTTYMHGLIAEGRVDMVRCPANENCKAEATPVEIRSYTDEETHSRYQRFTQMRSDPTLRQCPQCEAFCKPVRDEEGGFVAEMSCSDCGKSFCYFHSNAHPGRSCEDYAKEVSIDDIEGAKMCPGCGIHTEKTSGCNHMTCSQCKHDWCWLCGKTIDDLTIHYSDANPDGCKQFSDLGDIDIEGHAFKAVMLCLLILVCFFIFCLIKWPVQVIFICLCCCVSQAKESREGGGAS